MKFELYSTSGLMADYMSILASAGFIIRGDENNATIEVDSLKSLLKINEVLLFHDIIIQGKNGDYAIEIYDDYRE